MILVTGATGLVGSHLILELVKKGKVVKALYRSESKKKRVEEVFRYYNYGDLFGKINWVMGDILDVPSLELAFEKVTKVYHCAALVSFDPKDEEQLRKVNIEGTANIVNFCIDYQIEKLCYVSSIAALGDLKDFEEVITEETEWNPEVSHSDYAISKYGAEMEVWRGYQEGLSVVVVNPGVILGPLFWEEGSGDIYKKVRNGMPFYTTGGTGFVSVNDVVQPMMQLMNAAVAGERYILVSETLTYGEITTLIAKKMNVQLPRIKATSWMLALAWRLDWFLGVFGKKRVLSKNMAKTLCVMDNYDASEIVRKLGYEFTTVETYINNLK
ncbi:NAD-dependent epimerase/dehydratase family protein [Flavobacterium sp.]|uniref:NAD-dependent epimerase/dehydratase family protein n=1 Tax=Flavobacterium sp. TaxID=239 RepID=UPI003D0CFCBD